MRGLRRVQKAKPPKPRAGDDKQHLARVRQQRCLIAGKRATITEWRGGYPKKEVTFEVQHICARITDPHHDQRRSQLGKDVGNTAPLCRFAHLELHAIGKPAFEARWEVSITKAAKRAGFATSDETGDDTK